MRIFTGYVGFFLTAALLVAAGGCKETKSGPDDTATDSEQDTAQTDTGTDAPEDTAVEDTVEDTVEEDTVVEDTVVEDTVEDTVEEEVVTGGCGDGTVNMGEQCDDGDTETEPCDATGELCAADCSMRLDLCGNASDDVGEQCDDGDDDSTDDCTTSCTVNDHGIGAPCSCTGGSCSVLDFTAGTIVGCDAIVSLADSSRTLGCVRSANDTTYGVQVYMAQGYCTLIAVGCSGALCFMVPTTGDVATFSCPAGYVEATDERTQMGMTITSKSCLVACDSDIDCRWNEAEAPDSPWTGSCGQYGCLPVGDAGELACTDDRT